MEARIGAKSQHVYGPVIPDMMMVVGKRTMEWDLNDWRWDGDLFSATPLSSAPSDCRSRQLFPAGSIIPANTTLLLNTLPSGLDNGKRESEKRRRAVVVNTREFNDQIESLNLKLGGPVTDREVEEKWEEGQNGKKSKIVAAAPNRAVCQVEDCRGDLTGAKDYHRRHKVCQVHSKATRALVGGVMQRFCQQCSRFHALQEFDEGKRSCRRRLAGHNRRRRKMPPETVVTGGSLADDHGSNYLLVSLLRILSNLHTNNNSDQMKDQDLLSHLMKNLASLAGSDSVKNISGLPASKDLQKISMPMANGTTREISNPLSGGRIEKGTSTDNSQDEQHNASYAISCHTRDSISANGVGRMKMTDIDLNSVYDDSQDSEENLESYEASVNLGTPSLYCAPWENQTQKSSPPRTSGNSGSTTTLSPSSSSGEAQGRTDRIVFKLFGKDPADFPVSLRKQVLDWLSNSPTDIESFIRPGCIILTIYLRLENTMWEELSCNLSSSLSKLLEASNESFWRTGWVYARVQHRVAFLYSGNVILDTPLPLESHKNPRISSIKPIAVPFSRKAEFLVKGYDILHTTSRLLCSLEGKYLAQESCSDTTEECDSDDEIQCLSFSCSIPDATGRGFVEIEDHSLNSTFFPFIVAEPDVCSEICTLESAIELFETFDDDHVESEMTQTRNDAMEFIQEMGWLLHRNQLKIRLAGMDPNVDPISFRRFRWLVDFAIDHDWCAVTKKLLTVVFSGIVDAGVHPSLELALQDMCLLHKAVRRNSRSMVEFLSRYIPDGATYKSRSSLLFKPDATGPGGLTPLHIAATSDGLEGVLDTLTDDPGSVGLEAWKSARDSTGLTPYDYASLRGYYSYINLVQNKINKKSGNRQQQQQQVVVDIPGSLLDYTTTKHKPTDGHKSAKVASFQTEKRDKALQLACSCQQKMAYRSPKTSLAFYRPAMVSMVAIAAVCVCVALLFKSSPEVLYVFEPFRWEHLEYGSS